MTTWSEVQSAVRPTLVGAYRNLVYNGGFETGTLEGWSLPLLPNYTWIEGGAYEGKSCLHLGAPTRNAISQDIDLVEVPESIEVGVDGIAYGSIESPPSFNSIELEVEPIEGRFDAWFDDVTVTPAGGWVAFKLAPEKWGQIGVKLGDTPIYIKQIYYSHTRQWYAYLLINGLWFPLPQSVTRGWHILDFRINGRPDYIINGDFEAGTLDPWKPVLSAYSWCVKIWSDGHRGNYCLALGPTRATHGAPYCGVEQNIQEVTAPFRFICWFKKGDLYKRDWGKIVIGKTIWMKGLGDGTVRLLLDSWDTTQSIRSGWNQLLIQVSPLEGRDWWEIFLNGNWVGGTTSEKVTVRRVEVGTSNGDEYEGGMWYFDTISLKKY